MLSVVDLNRAAIEYEKRTRASNLEQSEAMEKGMVAMSQEVGKLQAELANAEKRARAAAAVTSPCKPSFHIMHPPFFVTYSLYIAFSYSSWLCCNLWPS